MPVPKGWWFVEEEGVVFVMVLSNTKHGLKERKLQHPVGRGTVLKDFPSVTDITTSEKKERHVKVSNDYI